VAAPREHNAKLAAILTEAGLTHSQVAATFVQVAAEAGAREFAAVGRSHVSHWVAGSQPSGLAPVYLSEALSRRLGRTVSPEEIGMTSPVRPREGASGWDTDTLIALADLRSEGEAEVNRRQALGAAFSAAALALPAETWWEQTARTTRPASSTLHVGAADVDAVREMTAAFSRIDQRRGGAHARSAAFRYLTEDVARLLRGRFPGEQVRRDMFAAAGELAYINGWMRFDCTEHAAAQRLFRVAVKLSAEADDKPLIGHILRAMAHQAADLGHPRHAVEIADASVLGERYSLACARERALLGVVRARALAAAGERRGAAAALIRAEDDLRAAGPGDDEPARVFFFAEASLAHETARTLRDIGDFDGAAREFQRSVRTRQAAAFTRTHVVTLGYLGEVLSRTGRIEEAASAWSASLDAVQGVQSGRTRAVVEQMRSAISPLRARSPQLAGLDARARAYLATAG